MEIVECLICGYTATSEIDKTLPRRCPNCGSLLKVYKYSVKINYVS